MVFLNVSMESFLAKALSCFLCYLVIVNTLLIWFVVMESYLLYDLLLLDVNIWHYLVRKE
jgi:hypothetical protein